MLYRAKYWKLKCVCSTLSLLGGGKWTWWNTSFNVPPVALIARIRMDGLHYTLLAGKLFDNEEMNSCIVLYLCPQN